MRRLGRALGATAVAGWLGALLFTILSASCGHQYFLTGSEVKPTSSSSATSTAGPTSSTSPTATPTAGLVFATNNADGTLSEFSRDFTSGTLTLIGTTAVGAALGPTGLALSSSNGFLYVANSADHVIREFSVDTATGALAAIGSVSDGPGSSPQRIAIDRSGKFLYVTDGIGATISQYTVASDGTLTFNGAFSDIGVVVRPIGIAAAPGGGAMYAADFGSGLVISLSIQPGGALALVNSVASLGPSGTGQPRGIVVDPTGAFVYVTDSAGGVVSVFSVNSGNALTFLASYSTAAPTHKTFDLALANNPATLFLYATNSLINTVSDFVVSTGVLSLTSAAGGLTAPQGIVSDPNGDFVYVANNGTGQVRGYAVGAAGALTAIGTFDTESPANPASQPVFLAITQ